jgi:hypothetical protein
MLDNMDGDSCDEPESLPQARKLAINRVMI